MNLLIVLNRTASEGAEGDVAWNALRLAQTSLVKGLGVRLFLMNQGVELAREDQPLWEEIDLAKMLGEILVKGGEVKMCSTCLDWHQVPKDRLLEGTQVAGMIDLVNWISDSDRVISF